MLLLLLVKYFIINGVAKKKKNINAAGMWENRAAGWGFRIALFNAGQGMV